MMMNDGWIDGMGERCVSDSCHTTTDLLISVPY